MENDKCSRGRHGSCRNVNHLSKAADCLIAWYAVMGKLPREYDNTFQTGKQFTSICLQEHCILDSNHTEV